MKKAIFAMFCLFLVGQFQGMAQHSLPSPPEEEMIKPVTKPSKGATIYSGIKYSGTSVHLKPTAYANAKTFQMTSKNRISSLYLTPGFIAIVYEQPNFKGQYKVLTAATPNLKHFNNKVASIKIFEVPAIRKNVTTLSKDSYFKGYQHSLNPGIYPNTQKWIKFGDNALSSLKVASDYQVILFDTPFFRGKMINITHNTPSLGSFDNKTSSALVVKRHDFRTPDTHIHSPK